MIELLKKLNKHNRCLLGTGYNLALLELIDYFPSIAITEFKSGTKVFDWEIPEEWIIRDAWVKFNGKKILDYKENPLCLCVGSISIHEKIDLKTFKEHLVDSEERLDAYSYDYAFYDKRWGFTIPKNIKDKQLVPEVTDTEKKYECVLEEGEYEVFIDSEYKPGGMKIGVHTIKGQTDREILLFAHLDHPYQVNDNLSGVVCLVDLAKKLTGYQHTVKLVFCPETIGSITYVSKMDTSKVDFMIALDCVGNNNSILFQKTFNGNERINKCALLALQSLGADYRAGQFRLLMGSDEYVFNDPMIGIPGIMFSRFPYPEYHTSDDNIDCISEEKIKQVGDVVLKTIEIFEKDFIPERKIKAPLMRSKYGVQTPYKLMNRTLDYLYYDIDGKKYLSEIINGMGISFEYALEVLTKCKIYDDSSIGNSKGKK